MEEYFSSPRALLERARENIKEFDERTMAFFKANNYERFERLDEATGEYCHGFSFVAIFEPKVTVVAFDVLNNLRSTLDHIVYASAEALGHPDPRQTKFPFGDTEQAAERDAKTCHPDEEMRSYLLSFKPYKDGGNYLLWGLNQLRNIKNHRRLLTPKFDVNGVTISHGVFRAPISSCFEWNAAGTDYVYLRTRRAGETNYQLSVQPGMRFRDVPVLEDEHAPTMFHRLADEIAGIIDGVERETSRILNGRNL